MDDERWVRFSFGDHQARLSQLRYNSELERLTRKPEWCENCATSHLWHYELPLPADGSSATASDRTGS